MFVPAPLLLGKIHSRMPICWPVLEHSKSQTTWAAISITQNSETRTHGAVFAVRDQKSSHRCVCRRLSESQREVQQTTWVFCCRKSEVCLLEHDIDSATGKTVCVWGFARPSTKLDMMLTWFWDYAAEPRSYRIWMRGYKYLLPALFLSSWLQLLHPFIT